MKKLTLLTALLISFSCFAQGKKLDKIADEITREGTALYKSEMASWNGTDIVLAKFPDKRDNLGGYFSYVVDNKATCIFYSKGDSPKVIASVTFDTTYSNATARIDGLERDFSATEKEYYTIRSKALNRIREDTLFKVYKNTDLNLIPIIKGNEKKVYVLTGPKNDGVVIFGNDYLITFDKNDEIKDEKKIHKNIMFIDINAKGENDSVKVTGSMHMHLPETGEYITATDICTLMLYEKYTPWEQHIVVSEKYMSIWMCKTNKLVIVSKDALNKIDKQ